MNNILLIGLLTVGVFTRCSSNRFKKNNLSKEKLESITVVHHKKKYVTQKIDSLSIKNRIKKYDSLLKARKNISVFVEKQGKASLTEVTDLNKWPKNIIRTYNAIFDDMGRPLLLRYIPFSESGDSYLEYGFYFDHEGNTIAIKIYRSFFNSGCVEGNLIEVITKHYNIDFELQKSNYLLQDQFGNEVDSSSCTFNYNKQFDIYKKYRDTPVFHHLSKKKK